MEGGLTNYLIRPYRSLIIRSDILKKCCHVVNPPQVFDSLPFGKLKSSNH